MGVTYTTPTNTSINVTFKDSEQLKSISTSTTRKKATYSPINSKGEKQSIPSPYDTSDSIALSANFTVPKGWRYKFYYIEPQENGLSINTNTAVSDILNYCTKVSNTSVQFTAEKGAKAIYLIQPSATKPQVKYKEMGNFVEFSGFDSGTALGATIGAPIITLNNPSSEHTTYYIFKYIPSNNSLAAATEFQIKFSS